LLLAGGDTSLAQFFPPACSTLQQPPFQPPPAVEAEDEAPPYDPPPDIDGRPTRNMGAAIRRTSRPTSCCATTRYREPPVPGYEPIDPADPRGRVGRPYGDQQQPGYQPGYEPDPRGRYGRPGDQPSINQIINQIISKAISSQVTS